jgi:hypothetical protein
MIGVREPYPGVFCKYTYWRSYEDMQKADGHTGISALAKRYDPDDMSKTAVLPAGRNSPTVCCGLWGGL